MTVRAMKSALPILWTLTAVFATLVLGDASKSSHTNRGINGRTNDHFLRRRQAIIEGYGTADAVYIVQKNTQCKNCPYMGCLNSGYMTQGTNITFDCWTHGEVLGDDSTWLKFRYGDALDEFCFVPSYDLSPTGSGHKLVPYCGSKTELQFYLPTVPTTVNYYTECSICPYRDCEGMVFYTAGTQINVDCEVDGWEQFGPKHPDGVSTYYRTPDNCYVSLNTVEELPGKPYIAFQQGNITDVSVQDALPPCGPVPMLFASDIPPPPTAAVLGPDPLATGLPIDLNLPAPDIPPFSALPTAPTPISPLVPLSTVLPAAQAEITLGPPNMYQQPGAVPIPVYPSSVLTNNGISTSSSSSSSIISLLQAPFAALPSPSTQPSLSVFAWSNFPYHKGRDEEEELDAEAQVQGQGRI